MKIKKYHIQGWQPDKLQLKKRVDFKKYKSPSFNKTKTISIKIQINNSNKIIQISNMVAIKIMNNKSQGKNQQI